MKLNLRDAWYRVKNRINLQYIKLSWLDMKRDKAKSFFGIAGIAISLFLLTAIGILNDTMNYNYVKMITNTTGNADILITRTIQTDITFDPFFDESIIERKLQDIEGVEQLFPRIMMLVKASSDKTTDNGTLEMYGIDFKLEADNGHIGNLLIADEDGNATDEIYEDEPSDGECVILYKISELLNVTKGDTIHLLYQQYTLDVKIVAICIQDLKFMQFESALIIINLHQAQTFMNREGKINMIYGTILNPERVYDASNVDATTQRLREIGSRIQDRLDIDEFSVTLPKLEELESGEFLLMGTTIIFWFITMLSMLITGILINSILSTSVEEREREFGILRVVGGKRTFPLKMVLFEGFMFGFLGSIIGITLGAFFTEPIVRFIFQQTGFNLFGSTDLVFTVAPQTILLGFTIGILVPLLVAILPAIRTARMRLIKSITPFRSKEEGWEIAKEGSVNVKSFLIGISIATIGMIIFVLLPRVFVTGDIMLIVSLFIGLLAAILIGLVFASVGIIPLIQKIFIGIISPGVKKYGHIIKISLKRYRRRNTSTVVMFAISFSFVFYITSSNEMRAENMELNLKFQYGADLVVINQGLGEDRAVTLEMVEKLKMLDGVDKVAYVLHNTFDIQAILSVFMSVSEEGTGFNENSAEQQITSLFNYYGAQESKKFQVQIADIPNFDSLQVGLIGVDQDFIDLMDQSLLIWKSSKSSFDYSFPEMLENNNTCIIAESIATVLGIAEVDTEARMTFINPQVENDPGNVTLFNICGISGGIPGFWNFRSSEFSASGGGVMISLDNYMRLMKVPNAGQNNMIIDKTFINLNENSEENIKNTKDDIEALFKDKDFIVDDAISKINYMDKMSDQQNSLMEIILMFTVIICIFGLISSMYAIMLERKFEIGILRSMGMKRRNVRNMFLIESLVILLSAGIMGTIIGSYCAYLMQTNLGLLTEMPVIFSIPMDTLLRVFIISVGVGIIGMYFILMKLSRQTIMEIFRQTF